MNYSSKGGSGFDPELAKKIEALEKQQALQRRCPSCGVVATTQRLTCQSCGGYYERAGEPTLLGDGPSKGAILTDEEAQLVALKSYLVKRIIAKLIDSSIMISIVAVEYMTYFAVVNAFRNMPQYAPALLNCFFWFMPVLTIASLLGFQAVFEASPVQATPGKLVMNLYVVDTGGKQMRSEPLVFKAFLSYLPFFGFGGVYMYFFVTKFQYGMQLDRMAACVLAISGVAFFVTFLSLHIIVGPEKKRQTIPDFLTGVMVQER